MSRNVTVCLTPELIHLEDLSGKLVIVVDIFRATSCMVAGMASGIQSITPVATVEECLTLKSNGYISAGERGGVKIPEFHLGNSPFDYMQPSLKGKKIATTTTNGTLAIKKSAEADEIVIGSFLNFSSVKDHIKSSDKDVIIHCAGWKGSFNLEDTTFAGGLLKELSKELSFQSDASFMACQLWEKSKEGGLYNFLMKSAHANRLAGMGIEKDLAYCCQLDEFNILPKIVGEDIITC